MRRITVPLSLLLTVSCSSPGNRASSDPPTEVTGPVSPEAKPLPLDPAVRRGTLDNGLTYFIRHHEKPEARVNLWLAVNAGSVLEDDDQLGLAHFVEHMAFNGTERFEKNTLIDFIERAGMDFGADLNAFTSFDETVYMLTVPTDDPKQVAMGMDILEDWSSAVTFDPVEVDKERGVVIEEWRLGRGAGQRTFDKQQPIFLAGSKYADRKPIGEKEILESAPVATLKRFYRDWYRPDNMAVVVVGDIDPEQMEKEIQARFADLKNPENSRERVNVPVPMQDKTRAAIVKDDEQSFSTLSLAIKGPLTPVLTDLDYRQQLVDQLFHTMLRARFEELGNQPDAPFVFMFSFTGEMGRTVDIFRLWAGIKPGQAEEVLQVMTTELERIRRHGFVETEYERARADLLRNLERQVEEEDKTDSRSFAFALVNHFLEGEALPSRTLQLELARAHLPQIALEDVNALAETWTSRKDQVILASGATRDKMPGEGELLALVEAARGAEIAPYVDEVVDGTLMATSPEPGTIVSRETIEPIGTSIWSLSNGARVVVKPTDFKNDEVRINAFSPGGTSLSEVGDWRTASSASAIVNLSGIGNFDPIELEKLRSGKIARVSPWISELEEGFWGSASPRDLELAFQMLHLYFTAPRKDPEAFQTWKEQQLAWIKNRDLNPQAVFREKLQAFSTNNHPRRQWLTPERLEEVEFEKALAIYEDRFRDAGDFTFVFVGNVDLAQLEELSRTYLASLPSTGRKETWKNVGIKYPRGVKTLTLEKGVDPKSSVNIQFHGKTRWSPEAEDDLKQLAEVLDIRLREVLREEMGGVYGAFSWGRIERRPEERFTYSIGFGCAPENVDKLKKAVFAEIDKIKRTGVSQDYVTKIKELRRRGLETDLKENGFWSGEIEDALRHGEDLATIVKDKEKAVERVSRERIQSAARKYLKKQYIEAVLNPDPEAMAAASQPDTKDAAGPKGP